MKRTKGRQPPPRVDPPRLKRPPVPASHSAPGTRKSIVTVIWHSDIDNSVEIYVDDDRCTNGECEIDIIDLLDKAGVHWHEYVLHDQGFGHFMDDWPASLTAALALPLRIDLPHDDEGDVYELDERVTLATWLKSHGASDCRLGLRDG